MPRNAKNNLDQLLKKYGGSQRALISILQDIQEQSNYLSEGDVRYVSEKLGLPTSQAFGVATFYRAFSLEPQGRYNIQVCLGTACHIKGAENLVNSLARQLNIQAGETTQDGTFSLTKVRCLGCCALAPVVKINQDTFSNVTQRQIPKVLQQYSK